MTLVDILVHRGDNAANFSGPSRHNRNASRLFGYHTVCNLVLLVVVLVLVFSDGDSRRLFRAVKRLRNVSHVMAIIDPAE